MLPPIDYQNLFLDMNSFFASVEQQVRPELRGKPVGVAPYIGNSGCIIAASYEAKQYGVKICRVLEAKIKCPGITIVESRPALYMAYHHKIKAVIESFTPYFRPLSIDEFLIHLTPSERNAKSAELLAGKLKAAIRARVGDYLKCSIGIGPSYFLAKMAGERRKPDGFTVVTLKQLPDFYNDLVLTDLVGINWRMERVLKSMGIYTPKQLYDSSLNDLHRRLKHWGRLWYFRLRGYEVDDCITSSKTIGHSHVLAPDLRTQNGALSVLEKLIFKAGYRLRQEGYMARGVSVVIGFTDKTNFHQSKKVPAFADHNTFRGHVFSLLKNCPWDISDGLKDPSIPSVTTRDDTKRSWYDKKGNGDGLGGFYQRRPIYLAVSSFNLVKSKSRQISIFPEQEKSARLSFALDSVNDEFGVGTIYPASMSLGKESAPDRIPFGRPRYEIKNE